MADHNQSSQSTESDTTPEITESRRWTIGAGDTHLATIRAYYTKSAHYEGCGFWTVTDVWVAAEKRNKGYATRLMNAMLETMRYDDLHLSARPFDYDESPALSIDSLIAWYEKFGFTSSPTSPANMIRRADPRPSTSDQHQSHNDQSIHRHVGGSVIDYHQHSYFQNIMTGLQSGKIDNESIIMVDGIPIDPSHQHYESVKALVDRNRRLYDEHRSTMPADHRCTIDSLEIDRFSNVIRCRVCLDRPAESSRLAKYFRVLDNNMTTCGSCGILIPKTWEKCPYCGFGNIS